MSTNNTKTTNESDYIVIPNPIYDVVFRYLMQDYESAKIVISTIINEKIKRLEFKPLTFAKPTNVREYEDDLGYKIEKILNKKRMEIMSDSNLSDVEKIAAMEMITITDPVTGKEIKLLHLDFSAVIETEDGEEELVMIELQKVDIETDVFRFKQYIAENFQRSKRITTIDEITGEKVVIEIPYRLIPIFILNFPIEDEHGELVVKSEHINRGLFTGKILSKRNKFIGHLTFDLFVVQLPYFKFFKAEDFADDQYLYKLFCFLQLFDQSSKADKSDFRLQLYRKVIPDFLQRVVKRLQTAAKDNPTLEKQMRAEDYYLKPLQKRDYRINWLLSKKKKMENELKMKNMVLEEKDKVLEKTHKALEEKDKVLENQNKIILQYAKNLKDSGKTTEEIQKLTNLSEDEINNL